MASFQGVMRRLRGEQTVELAVEVAGLRDDVLRMNHFVAQIHETLMALNHDVRSGSEEALPLFVGYTERLRLDADTAIGATQVIERQLALIEERLAAAPSAGSS